MNATILIATSRDDIERCFTVRRAVFVGEQSVPVELEMDDLDAEATHFLILDEAGEPIGTARLLSHDDSAKIGRVAVLRNLRGQGHGRAIMEAVLAEARRRGFREALLSSQTYAIPFYERLGFIAHGPVYDEAGIPHRKMRLGL
jgi:predicted GNAT family N-acyltransferase